MAVQEDQAKPADAGEAPSQKKAAAAGAAKPAPAGMVTIGGNFDIDPARPLPQFDTPSAQAFQVTSRNGGSKPLFAAVCTGPMPVRLGVLQTLVGIDNLHMVKLVHSGIVVWPVDGAQRVVMVFEQPLGAKLADAQDRVRPWPFELMAGKVIAPIASVIGELSARGIFHGGIRPSNIFAGQNVGEGVTLGECVTAPAGYYQPVLYETMQRGLADPAGRGAGHVSDDIYALGVTIITLVQGEPPLAGMNERQIVDAKVSQGSFYALVQKQRIPTPLLEPLRGMLNDDPALRWTLEDISLWLGGRRLSPRPPEPPRRAVRPFEFSGHEAWEARGLTRILSLDPLSAHRLYAKGEVEAWMRRALGEKNITEIMVGELQASRTASRAQREPEVVVARCAIAIAPDAPMRMRGRSAFPSGIGTALTEAMILKKDPAGLIQMVLSGMPGHWKAIQRKHKIEAMADQPDLEHARGLMERSGYGYGVERVMYELDETVPCLSPMLANHYVLTSNDLLRALERLAPTKSRHGMPIDTHIAAFIMVRFRKLEDWLLKSLNDTIDPGRQVVAMAHILGAMQERLGNRKLPNLCRWIVTMADPAIDRLHNNKSRTKMRDRINELAEQGMILPIAQTLDDTNMIRHDGTNYAKAQSRFAKIIDDIVRLEGEVADPRQLAHGFGRELAAVISGVLGALGASGIIAYFLLGL